MVFTSHPVRIDLQDDMSSCGPAAGWSLVFDSRIRHLDDPHSSLNCVTLDKAALWLQLLRGPFLALPSRPFLWGFSRPGWAVWVLYEGDLLLPPFLASLLGPNFLSPPPAILVLVWRKMWH